jgi:four helix bundle protein
VADAIRRFEDLVAWQKARVLAASVYRLCATGMIARDYEMKDQMRRAVLSVMSNVAEGFERGNPSENLMFLRYAKASCGELRSQLYVALDAEYLTEEQFTQLMNQAEEVGRLVGGLKAAVERYRDNK